jgi:prephenate dehydratase
MRLALLGPRGTYSEEAARAYAPGATLLFVPTHEGVFRALANEDADEGIVAIENQLEGTVVENVDLLGKSMLFVTSEVIVPIHHCIAALPGAGTVSRILSHPKALSQCREHIARHHRGVALEERPSTAAAMEELSRSGDAHIAVIGSEAAAKMYGLDILEQGIEDYRYNATRFFVLASRESREGDKTSVIFAVSHTPGSLWESIGSFAKNGVNLAKLESRPIRERSWEYLFFVDAEGGLQEERMRKALQDLQEHTTFLRVLGSYRRWRDDQ